MTAPGSIEDGEITRSIGIDPALRFQLGVLGERGMEQPGVRILRAQFIVDVEIQLTQAARARIDDLDPRMLVEGHRPVAIERAIVQADGDGRTGETELALRVEFRRQGMAESEEITQRDFDAGHLAVLPEDAHHEIAQHTGMSGVGRVGQPQVGNLARALAVEQRCGCTGRKIAQAVDIAATAIVARRASRLGAGDECEIGKAHEVVMLVI